MLAELLLVAAAAPLLAAGAGFIAHPQIRNRGTLGGTLAHADPAAELPVVSVALEARFRIVQAGGGERWAEAAEFFVGLLTADLQPGELRVVADQNDVGLGDPAQQLVAWLGIQEQVHQELLAKEFLSCGQSAVDRRTARAIPEEGRDGS